MPISDYVKNLRDKVGTDLLLMPCAAAVVRNNGRILLQRRADTGRWALPGGAIDPGEEPAKAVARETWEETGLRVRPVKVLGVFGGTEHIYPNGDRAGIVLTVFECEIVGGELACLDGEATDLRYFDPSELPEFIVKYPEGFFTGERQETFFYWRDEWVPE